MTRLITIERTSVVYRSETWRVEVPDGIDVKAWIEADPAAFEEHMGDSGDLDDVTYETPDDEQVKYFVLGSEDHEDDDEEGAAEG